VIDPEDENDGIMARQCLFEEAFFEGASLGDAHAFAGCDFSLRTSLRGEPVAAPPALLEKTPAKPT
jgi:hypothetical protein